MARRRQPTRSTKAPSRLIFRTELNPISDKKLPCVYAKCLQSDRVVGPIWSHTAAGIKRALATLTAVCECPAKFHEAREAVGKRVHIKKIPGKPSRSTKR